MAAGHTGELIQTADESHKPKWGIDMKTVSEKVSIEKAKDVEIMMEGSGDPKDDHVIVGVRFLDKNGKCLFGFGGISKKADIFGLGFVA